MRNLRPLRVFLPLIGLSLFLLLVPNAGYADLPETINYQGRLAATGGALVNGTVAMSFSIYNVKTGGTALWTESYATVQVTNGQFSVDLGSVVTMDLPFDEKYWLGVTVGTDPEMTPRKPFTSVGYAVRSLHAQNADHASQAQDANNATDALHADTADEATHALTADTATSAGTATTATSALSADSATHADDSDHATAADTADLTLGRNEVNLAIVTPDLRSGDPPGPGVGVYTDPATAMLDRSIWCSAPSASSPCLLRIMPGTYVLGAPGLPTEPWVEIQGSGEQVTIIQLASTVNAAPDSTISHLTLEFQTGLTSDGMQIQDDEVRISHVTLKAPTDPSWSDAVIRVGNGAPTPVRPDLSHVTISMDHGIGVHVMDASPRLSHVRVRIDATSSSSATGFHIEGSYSSPVITNAEVTAAATGPPGNIIGVQNVSGATPLLKNLLITFDLDSGGGTGPIFGVRSVSASPTVTDARISGTVNPDLSLKGVYAHGGGATELQRVWVDLDRTMGGGGGTLTGIENNGASTLILMGDVQVAVGSDDCGEGYGVRVMNADLGMSGSRVTVQSPICCPTLLAMEMQNSTVEITRSTVASEQTGGGCGPAIVTASGSTLNADHSVIRGSGSSIEGPSSPGVVHLIGASKLIGNVQGMDFDCVGSYTEDPPGSLRALDSNCN